jgi:glycosyltransferase involved in cell wall biosynthesis
MSSKPHDDGGPLGQAPQVLCVTNMFPGPSDPDYGVFVSDICAALERRGVPVAVAAIDTRARGAVRTPAKYAGLVARTAAAARGADVIWAHYLFPTGAIAAACGRAARRPWVLTAHGGDVRNLARPALRRASAAAISGASALIAVSRHLRGELRASGLSLPPVAVVNMGVDLRRFALGDRGAARRRLGIAPQGPLVLAVGGLTERKNPLTLLQAFARVRAAAPDARLALVGDGPLARAVDAGAAALGLGPSLIRPGALPHAQVVDWMAACDLLALVSRVEPLGQVALEALASGRPVVATRVGGTAEVVPDGRAGALVDPADPGAIAAAILALLAAPPDPAVCRAAAEEHDVDRQAERIEAILREVVAHGARRRRAP